MATSTASPRAARDPGNPLAVALIVIGLLLAFSWLPRLGLGAGNHKMVNSPAPDFALEVVHAGAAAPAPYAAVTGGSTLRLAELKGRPVLLDFWATWCGPCRREAPILSRVADRFRDRGLVVLGINTGDRPGLAAPFAAQNQLSYPILFDATHDAADRYDVDTLPTLVMIGKDGAVRAVHSGLINESTLASWVESAL
jgi:cytochrome c biogenesis protein CcmG/thiol:disulfide interchange protein DsbE